MNRTFPKLTIWVVIGALVIGALLSLVAPASALPAKAGAPAGIVPYAAREAGAPVRPLADLLNPDGTVNLGTGFSGSLNAAGWAMQGGLKGAPPRFVPAAGAGASAAGSNPAPSDPQVAGDELWDARFGVPGQGINGNVFALAVSSNGTLYAGGSFSSAGTTPVNNIAAWDGSSWSALGSGIDGVVYSLAVSGTTLYAGGLFTTAGGLTVNNIATWHNGNWWQLGSGMDGDVLALAVSGTTLYAGGYFDHAGGLLVNNIAAWNGSSWSAMSSGVTPSSTGVAIVYALAVSGSTLYAGGEFLYAGGIYASGIAAWNGSAWSSLALGLGGFGGYGQVYALVAVGSYVYAAGSFNFAYQPGTPLGLFVNNIAEWDGSAWLAMGAAPHTGVDGIVYGLALGTFQNFPMLYVAGELITDPGNMLAWTGVSWGSILGSGTDNVVHALAMTGTDLNVGGEFTTAGAKPSMHFGIFHAGGNTPTSTPTRTTTQTNTPTSTAVPPTNTSTWTATSTSTTTPVPPTDTPTDTPTSTAVPPTDTPTTTPVPLTETPTSTALTLTETPTSTALTLTETPTDTPTSTNTVTGIATATHTGTATATATQTVTVTVTGTNTPTNTPSGAPTDTPSSTPTNTSTVIGTSTGTPALTETPVPSNTSTHTSTGTNTALPATQTPGAGTATPTGCVITFIDVPPDSTFYSYIRCLACRGIVSGYSDGTFRPGNDATRGQIAKMVSNAAGFTEDPGPQIYEDVAPGSTFYNFVQRLASRGFINGYPCGGVGEPCDAGNLPYFRPADNATRGQTAKIVSNTAGFNEPGGVQMFEDVAPGATFYDFIQRLASRTIINGYPCGGVGEPCGTGNLPYFRPINTVARGQTAKIVANTFFPDCQVRSR